MIFQINKIFGRKYTKREISIKNLMGTNKHWYHQIVLSPNITTPGINNSKLFLKHLDLPSPCKGLRVLDIGTADGFFAFEVEKRGGNVIAIDYRSLRKNPGFRIVSNILQSKVKYVTDNVYNITPKKYGMFDIVLFLGTLYHLPDPFLALETVKRVCKNLLYLETQTIDNAFLTSNKKFVPLSSLSKELVKSPIMQFYPKGALNNDPTNFWAPNMACIEAMLLELDIKILKKKLLGARAIFKCKVENKNKENYYLKIARGIVG